MFQVGGCANHNDDGYSDDILVITHLEMGIKTLMMMLMTRIVMMTISMFLQQKRLFFTQ